MSKVQTFREWLNDKENIITENINSIKIILNNGPIIVKTSETTKSNEPGSERVEQKIMYNNKSCSLITNLDNEVLEIKGDKNVLVQIVSDVIQECYMNGVIKSR